MTRSNRRIVAASVLTILNMGTLPLSAQTPSDAGQPPVAASGSESVITNNKPALRLGDAGVTEDMEAVPDVFINGKPAIVCKNPAGSSSSNVFIHGKPQARVGDSCK
jgi:uncharacterized Zn-binding protein involved in type VI secretion